jgi:hypothetical protein
MKGWVLVEPEGVVEDEQLKGKWKPIAVGISDAERQATLGHH